MAFIVRRLGPRSYATTFPLTENPISEGGMWMNTLASGAKICLTSGGMVSGGGPSASPPYDDPAAILTGAWGPVQTAEAVIQIDALPGVNAEVELLLHATMYPGIDQLQCYQFQWSITGNPYYGTYRNTGPIGAIGDFVLIDDPGPQVQLQTGYRVKATSNGNGLLTAYLDTGSGYVQFSQGTDTTYRGGSPGVGFFQHAGPGGPLSGWGFSSFSASSV